MEMRGQRGGGGEEEQSKSNTPAPTPSPTQEKQNKNNNNNNKKAILKSRKRTNLTNNNICVNESLRTNGSGP